ncbi:MAG: dTDP-4-dehydrorhamnose 3,5-epimerase [Isosphaeraceae bacterium]|jgi:dTDP-4-dehydrorhamnose 3,5-epimerase|nr:MAG: dTDP-4-dehydrorhamnose 3,5-epimerase [Isosphaeraceae bacterium]
MIYHPTRVAGAFVVERQPHTDHRGSFARAWCAAEARTHGLADQIAQVNVSRNRLRGTLRGLHYQATPHAEAKLIACTAGALYDVVVDLRPNSPTFLAWDAVELDAESERQLYVPPGCAHGFQTLRDNTQVLYLMSTPHAPRAARGIRYDDPTLHITWPLPVTAISETDLAWPFCDPDGLPPANP